MQSLQQDRNILLLGEFLVSYNLVFDSADIAAMVIRWLIVSLFISTVFSAPIEITSGEPLSLDGGKFHGPFAAPSSKFTSILK